MTPSHLPRRHRCRSAGGRCPSSTSPSVQLKGSRTAATPVRPCRLQTADCKVLADCPSRCQSSGRRPLVSTHWTRLGSGVGWWWKWWSEFRTPLWIFSFVFSLLVQDLLPPSGASTDWGNGVDTSDGVLPSGRTEGGRGYMYLGARNTLSTSVD